jgi:hypothetical protein
VCVASGPPCARSSWQLKLLRYAYSCSDPVPLMHAGDVEFMRVGPFHDKLASSLCVFVTDWMCSITPVLKC